MKIYHIFKGAFPLTIEEQKKYCIYANTDVKETKEFINKLDNDNYYVLIISEDGKSYNAIIQGLDEIKNEIELQ